MVFASDGGRVIPRSEGERARIWSGCGQRSAPIHGGRPAGRLAQLGSRAPEWEATAPPPHTAGQANLVHFSPDGRPGRAGSTSTRLPDHGQKE